MQKTKAISPFFVLAVIAISLFGFHGISKAADVSTGTQEETKNDASSGIAPESDTSTEELAASYTLRLLYQNTETPVETVTFRKDDTGIISATMECEKYGKQEIPVVYFDGNVLKFIALAGSNHDENFYFELKFYGTFLIGEAEGGRGPIPVIAKDTRDKIYW